MKRISRLLAVLWVLFTPHIFANDAEGVRLSDEATDINHTMRKDAVMSRYEGKPFLKLLDFYVLKSIGRIEPEQLNALAQLEPKLRETYATQGTWFEIVAEQMDLPDELPSHINAAWDSYSKHMQQKGLTADPMEFTYRFVDTNLIAN
ncbi:hypothetical protein SAMN04490187_2181 [Pseudomonas jessenii]|uniref:Uncharacterized protein n=1 Tax=Pseudomonas jessenii TaxID=77298 RepID=A0A1H4MN18_PSEJE|nr:hypothetical protein [Pseudomonas jessenii]SEB84363.1 hypothetical protein SAMN04490187_2181 [Pseudomonas jessenii]